MWCAGEFLLREAIAVMLWSSWSSSAMCRPAPGFAFRTDDNGPKKFSVLTQIIRHQEAGRW